MTAPHFPHPDDSRLPEQDSVGLVDWSLVRDRVGFALRATRRRPIVALLCFVAIASLGPVSLAVMPRTYEVEAIVTAGRNPIVSTLAYPVLQRPFESEDPAQLAQDMILRRDNLEALIEETGLLEHWLRTRAPLVRFRDRVLELVTGKEPTREERIEGLVERLEKRFKIEVPGAQPGAPPSAAKDRVVMTLQWPHAEIAKVFVETAARRFFENRREREVSMVRDAVGVLEVHAAGLRREIEAKVRQVHELELGLVRGNTALSRTDRSQRGRVPEEQALARLRATLDSKKLALAELERLTELRSEELRSEYARVRTAYSEEHPDVVRTRKLLERLSVPPQLAALRSEIVELEQDIDRAAARVARLVDGEDPALEYQRTELRLLLTQYSTVRDRIDGAHVEAQAAKAGFGHRYGFTVPPRIPTKPIRPIASLAIAAGVLAGVLFSLFAATALDARSGRIIERWQIERTLHLRVVGELRS